MMSEYPLMPSDSTPESSLALALALKDKLSPPHQSNFRVFCVMPFVDLDDHTLRYVTGTNAEACALHSSFCAERTALVTLRNHPRGFERLANVKALYIVCDGPTEITPGLLCREMLSSFIPMETPIWLGARADDGAIIQRCMTLAELLPFPHVYRGLRSSEIPPRFHQHRELYPIARLVADLIAESSSIVSEQQLLLLANSVHAAIADDASTVHFAHIAAGVLFADGTVFATSQDKGLEYSTSLPADVKVFAELQRRRSIAGAARPVCFLIADHLGVWHAPCGQARALLNEHGYSGVHMLVWCEKTKKARWTVCGDMTPSAPQNAALFQLANASEVVHS